MISVCMATYNGAKYIKEQIDSILCQLSPNDELIISDDESTDNTLDIIHSFNDNRIKIIHHTKSKQKYIFGYTSSNFENTLNNASGDYIFLSDQDDIWLPDRVEQMLVLLKEFDVILTDCRIVDENLNVLLESKFQAEGKKLGVISSIIKNRYLGCTMAFKRSVLDYAVPFPTNVPHDLWIGITAKIRGRVTAFEVPTLLYRRHNNNVSATSVAVSKKNKNLPKTKNSLKFKIAYRLTIAKNLIEFLIKKS